MSAAKAAAREFLATDSFYNSVIQDDGSAKAKAVRRAEASLATVKAALVVPFERDVRALILTLAAGPSATQINAVSQASDRMIDVADTLGFPLLARVAASLREACETIQDGQTKDAELLALFGQALEIALDRREPSGTSATVSGLLTELRRRSTK